MTGSGCGLTLTVKFPVSSSLQREATTLIVAVPVWSFHWMSTWSVPCPLMTLPAVVGLMLQVNTSPFGNPEVLRR